MNRRPFREYGESKRIVILEEIRQLILHDIETKLNFKPSWSKVLKDVNELTCEFDQIIETFRTKYVNQYEGKPIQLMSNVERILLITMRTMDTEKEFYYDYLVNPVPFE